MKSAIWTVLILLATVFAFQNCEKPISSELSSVFRANSNGTPYNGKLAYEEPPTSGSCPDGETSKTKVEVSLSEGLPSSASVVRRDCANISPTPIKLQEDLKFSTLLDLARTPFADLSARTVPRLVDAVGPLSLICTGTSGITGHLVTITLTRLFDGHYSAKIEITSGADRWVGTYDMVNYLPRGMFSLDYRIMGLLDFHYDRTGTLFTAKAFATQIAVTHVVTGQQVTFDELGACN